MSNPICPIWGTRCTAQTQGYATLVDSKRAGGRYFLPIDIEQQLRAGTYGLTDRDKAVLTTWIANRNRHGDVPRISAEVLQRVRNREIKPMSPYHRAELLLRAMGEDCDPGQWVSLNNLAADDDVLSLTESASEQDAELLVDFLVAQELLQVNPSGGLVKVSLHGYQRLTELDAPNTDSRQVFVAMWFNDTTRGLRESIRQAIEAAGMTPYIIDEDSSYENKICDKIEVEIRRSRLLVADFTHGDDGARGSVYYEAGLARGLGLPVVWVCRESQIKDVHFDTNHYPHLGWENDQLADFRNSLSDRLRLLIAQN